MDLGAGRGPIDLGRYCREVETHLCRKNDGHLIRIVGPSFELVSRWAAQGIPLRVVFEGIDRFFERYYRKGPRRRPVHIAFCEDDVLSAFDAWRRATGVVAVFPDAAASFQPASSPTRPRQRQSLAAHLDRTIAALTARRAGAPPALDAALERAVREVDLLRAQGAARGEARVRVLERLRALEEALLADARSTVSSDELAALTAEAEEGLTPFKARMPAERWETARVSALDRALRSALKLPVIAFE